MSHPIEQLITSLAKKPAPRGFDPDYLNNDSIDPSVRADAGAGAMSGELRNRLFQAERTQQTPAMSPGVGTSPNEVSALQKMLTGYDTDRSKSPLGGPTPLAAQQAEYGANRANTIGAINEGFTGEQAIEQQPGGGFTSSRTESPMQQREIYKRQQTERNSPATLQAGRIEDSQFQQGRQLNSLNRQISAQMAPAQQRADLTTQMWSDLVNKRVTADQVRSFNPSTGAIGFQTTPGINPNHLNNNLQRELGFAQAAGVTDPFETFGQPDSPTLATDNAIRAVITSSGIQPRSQQIVLDVLSDAEARQLSFDELAQLYQDFDELGADTEKVRQLLMRLRGK